MDTEDLCHCQAHEYDHDISDCKIKNLFSPACAGCKENSTPILMDFGIGPGEFWGRRFVDTDEQLVSNCCEKPLFLPYSGAEYNE